MTVLVVLMLCAVLGAVLAQSKNRSPLLGGLVGLLAGPIGVVILACMRKLEPGETERAFKIEKSSAATREP